MECPNCGTPVNETSVTDGADKGRQRRPIRSQGFRPKRGKKTKTSQPKAAKKNTEPKRPTTGRAELVKSKEGNPTWHLQNFHGKRVDVSFEYDLEDGSMLSPNYVAGKSLWYKLETRGNLTIARPVHDEELERCIDRSNAKGSKELLSHKRGKELGQSAELLKLGKQLPKALSRIEHLEKQKDDPEAWAELAHGFKISGLIEPLKKAISEVGWEKFKLLQKMENEEPGSWPKEFLDCLIDLERQEKERTAPSKVRRQRRSGDYGYDDTG